MRSDHLLDAGDAALPTGDVTLVTCCPVCTSDSLEPAAVGGDVDGDGRDALFLVTRCTACGCRYVNPPPPSRLTTAATAPARTSRLPESVLGQWTDALKPGADVLEVGAAGTNLKTLERLGLGGWQLTCAALAEISGIGHDYDLVILNHALEHASRPADLLHNIARRLHADGRIIVVVHNVRSPSFALFGGRHWAGYADPALRQVLGLRTIRRVVAATGLRVVALSSVAEPSTWRRSLDHLTTDWDLPGAALAERMASPIEAAAHYLRRGALLAVLLEDARS